MAPQRIVGMGRDPSRRPPVVGLGRSAAGIRGDETSFSIGRVRTAC